MLFSHKLPNSVKNTYIQITMKVVAKVKAKDKSKAMAKARPLREKTIISQKVELHYMSKVRVRTNRIGLIDAQNLFRMVEIS